MSEYTNINIHCCHPKCMTLIDWTGKYICEDCGERFCIEHLNDNQLCPTCEEYQNGNKSLRQFKIVDVAWTHYHSLAKILNRWGASGCDWKPVMFNTRDLEEEDKTEHIHITRVLFMRERHAKQLNPLRAFWKWLFCK